MEKRGDSAALPRDAKPSLLEVTPHIYPDVMGGIPLSVDGLAIALAGSFNTTVAANWMGPRIPPRDPGYNLVVFRTRFAPFGNPISAGMMMWLLRNVRSFDLVHAHSHLFVTSILAVFISKLCGTPVILTNHGFISHSQPLWLQRLWIRLVSQTFLRMCDRIVCFTQVDADRLVGEGANHGRIVVSPNPVNLADFQPTQREFTGPLRLLWLGRMAPEKGLDTLLSALCQLRGLRNRVRLTLIGAGPLEGTLHRFASENGLEGAVTFQRAVGREDVPSVLASHDVMILPSLTEGFPRVAVEALATGMPLLCSALPQLTDSLGDCAFYFQPGDVDSIAAAIAWADGNRQLLVEMGARGLSLVARKYAWEITVTERALLFSEVIEESQGKSGSAQTDERS